MARIKGSGVREFLRWYEAHHPHRTHGLRQVLLALPPELGQSLDVNAEAFGILASEWYDVRIVHSLMDAAVLGLSEPGRHVLAREGVRSAIASSMHGVYRFVIERLSTPEMYARGIQRLWGILHDTGRREIIVNRAEKRAISGVWDWAGHHPFLCELVSETTGQLFEKMGCKGVVIQRGSCVAHGHARCETLLTWR